MVQPQHAKMMMHWGMFVNPYYRPVSVRLAAVPIPTATTDRANAIRDMYVSTRTYLVFRSKSVK